MKRIGFVLLLFTGFILALPPLTAQDDKKEEKAEKKDSEKKDEKKDPEKKDDEKKKPDTPPVKEKKLTEKMPPYSTMMRTKILSANGASNREFTVEIQEVDPKKVADLNTWKFQQTQSLAQQQANALRAQPQQRAQQLLNYQKAMANYNIELAKRSQNIYSTRPMEIRAHDDAKVRTLFLPVMFDDEGRQKKWTEKEKKEFRGDTMLPGYPSDFDAIKSGQFVEIYMHKKAVSKDAPKKKKGPDDEPAIMMTPEFIVIVILAEGK